MSEIRVSTIIKALLSKGFVQRETHHVMLWFQPTGRHTNIVTRFSHSERFADDWLLGNIARQLHLSKKQLLALIECTISEAEYFRLMVEHGHASQ